MYPRLEKYLLGTKYACIEVEMRSDKMVYHLTVINRSGGKLRIDNQIRNVEDLGDLSTAFNRKMPVALVITGKGVINKRYNGNVELSDEALLRTVLPGADPDGIVISRYHIDERTIFISGVRRETVAGIMESLSNVSIISVVIGPCVAESLFKELQIIDGERFFSNHRFRLNSDALVEVGYVERSAGRNVFIYDNHVHDENIISFACALQGLNHTSGIPGEAAGFSEQRQSYFLLKRYGAFVTTYILVALLVLLANFFAFLHLRNVKSELESDPALNNQSWTQLHQLKQKLEANKQYLDASGMNSRISHSWIADQLALNVPGQIVLTQINIAPGDRFAREDTIGFRPGNILITGNCTETIALNDWLKVLQASGWIRSARISDYNNEGKNDGRFELEIEYQ